MVNEIRIYFEGDKTLKPGFHAFFSEAIRVARQRRCRVQFISTNGTPAQDYKIALVKHPGAWNILLLDSHGPDSGSLSVTFCRREGVDERHARSVFWMVQLMEAWFLADTDALETYYGAGFQRDALPHNPKVEEVPKDSVYAGLKAATRRTAKGEYHKTRHGPKLLNAVSPERVKNAAPNCRLIFDSVLNELNT